MQICYLNAKLYIALFLIFSLKVTSAVEAPLHTSQAQNIFPSSVLEIPIPRQGIIIEKMASFLKMDTLAESEDQLRVVRELIESKGECLGLSNFWVLSKRIADEVNPHKKPRDDIYFFKKVIHLLLSKVPDLDRESVVDKQKHDVSPLTELERKAIRRFIGHVLFFQKKAHEFTKYETVTKEQGPNVDIAVAYHYLTGKNLVEMVGLNPLVCTKEILKVRLKEMIKPGALITIATNPITSEQNGSHAIAVYQSLDGIISYYDPNQGEKSYVISSAEAEEDNDKIFDRLAKDIFDSTSLESNPMRRTIVDSFFRVLPIFIYRFEKDNIEPYRDFNLSFAEKESIRENWFVREGRVDQNLKDIIDGVPVRAEDLKREIFKQHSMYEKKVDEEKNEVNEFMDQLMHKISGFDEYLRIPFVKSIKKSDLFICAQAVTELLRQGYGIRVYHLSFLTQISRNNLTYLFKEDNIYDLVRNINVISYFRNLNPPQDGTLLHSDIRNLFNGSSYTIDSAVLKRIEQKTRDYEDDLPYVRTFKEGIYIGALGYALRSNYSRVVAFLLNEVNIRHQIDSENSGRKIFYSIRELKDTIQNIRESLDVMLSESVRSKSKPSLFWIAASIKEILIQKNHLPTQIKSRNKVDFTKKMEQLDVMEKMLTNCLDRRMKAGEKLTREEEIVLGELSFNRIEKP